MANSASGEAVLDRVMRILSIVEMEQHLPAGQLARQTGLPKSTAYRLIDDLARRGLLQRDARGEVTLGRRIWGMAQHTPLAAMLRQAALPQMQELNSLVGQTVQLAVLEDAQVLIVERLSRTGAVTNPAEVGTHMPVHLTSMGHVLLAYSPRETAESVIRQQQHRIASERPQLRSELADTRRRGFSRINEAIHTGTMGISAPVIDEHASAVAALTLVVPSDDSKLGLYVSSLQAAARSISKHLRSYHLPPSRPASAAAA